MESKEDRLLGSVIANHLFLSQFELFRACLLTLSARSPGVARDILQTVIRKIWTLKGVVWSESVPSSAHMAWLCLQELHAMEEKLMDGGAAKPQGDPWEAAASTSAPPGAALKHNHWQFYCRPVYDCIEFLLLLEFVKQFVVARDNSGMNSSGTQNPFTPPLWFAIWVFAEQCRKMSTLQFRSMNVPLNFNNPRAITITSTIQ
jgi:hypothetical protein